MVYYTKVLQADETVRYVGGLHWTIYRNAILLAVVAVAALTACLSVSGDWQLIVLAVAGLFLLLAGVSFLGAWFVRITTEIVVTDRRIIHKVGWIARRTEEMNITKVETVDVSQGIGGRIFNYGTVAIRGIGGGWEPLRRVGSPLELRNAIVVG
ncbi:PH domain-containing protein [Acidisphaera sp. S103]|uniref:PH domain-containing protein n=1 Tax=Acidisphaera sp. S103 TaxID=1747223 RepID=UPI00131CD331|nr:PH domain-containing protein [Acidisphaera sp. S103]